MPTFLCAANPDASLSQGRSLRMWQNWPNLGTFRHAIPTKLPDMNEADGEILTLDEVAAYLKAGKKTVYRLAQQGQIPGFKLGGTWRFRRTELDRWIAAQIAQTPQDRT